jgi:hypothetical protein
MHSLHFVYNKFKFEFILIIIMQELVNENVGAFTVSPDGEYVYYFEKVREQKYVDMLTDIYNNTKEAYIKLLSSAYLRPGNWYAVYLIKYNLRDCKMENHRYYTTGVLNGGSSLNITEDGKHLYHGGKCIDADDLSILDIPRDDLKLVKLDYAIPYEYYTSFELVPNLTSWVLNKDKKLLIVRSQYKHGSLYKVAL